ncbi:hypothetical protein JOD54_006419 [Actinokineospora baliensis]|uniref:hypothetical protein n=1 Tax=Actinokineospora baliensis TaxID=547056 RepID=UPI001959777D|nr:hypothetical protein [Actinokineospora baliensis]MBM7776215.1 hypothetical protein [Actinokineospora baliensis]
MFAPAVGMRARSGVGDLLATRSLSPRAGQVRARLRGGRGRRRPHAHLRRRRDDRVRATRPGRPRPGIGLRCSRATGAQLRSGVGPGDLLAARSLGLRARGKSGHALESTEDVGGRMRTCAAAEMIGCGRPGRDDYAPVSA